MSHEQLLEKKNIYMTVETLTELQINQKNPIDHTIVIDEENGRFIKAVDSQKPLLVEETVIVRESFGAVEIVPGLGENSQLKDTGFNISLEMNRFFAGYNGYLERGEMPEQALLLSWYEQEANIRTFTREYIEAGLVLPGLVATSRGRLVNSYDNEPIVDKITKQERFGKVWEGSKKVEDFFSLELPNSMAVIISPDGWTGLRDLQGREIKYQDCQVLVFWKDEQGQLRQITLVTDLTKRQSVELACKIGAYLNLPEDVGEEQLVSEVVGTPVLLASLEGKLADPMLVVERLLEVRGRERFKFIQDGEIEYRRVEEMVQDVNRWQELLRFNEAAEELINRLKHKILSFKERLQSFDVQKEIASSLEQTILSITRSVLREKKAEDKVSTKQGVYFYQDREEGYADELAYLKSRAGCAGGGQSVLRGFGNFSFGSKPVFGGTVLVSRPSSEASSFCHKCGDELCLPKCVKCGE